MATLDTTVFVDLRGRGGKKKLAEAEEIVRRLVAQGHVLATTRINIAEMYVGVELSNDPIAERSAVEAMLTGIRILELDDLAAASFGRLQASLRLQGKLAGDMDTLIGAIALVHGEPVVTRNVLHFSKMPGLTVIGYGP